MNFFNLLKNRKQNNLYNDFLEAYAQLREMTNPIGNLNTVARCLTEEHEEAGKRCMDYYITHDIDRVILQLHATEPEIVENFYLLALPLCDHTYLSGELLRFIWRYNDFNRLCIIYCELCVVNNIFNLDLASRLIERFPTCTSAQEGLIIVTKLEAYREYFAERELGSSLQNAVYDALPAKSSRAFSLMNLLIYYEDISTISLTDQLDLDNIFTNIKANDFSVKEKDGLDYNTQKNNSSPESEILYENILLYFIDLFKTVKSESFRIKIIKHSVCYIKDTNYISFVISCIMNDPVVMVSLLSERKPKAVWSPLEIYKLIENVEEEDLEDLIGRVFFTNPIGSNTSGSTTSIDSILPNVGHNIHLLVKDLLSTTFNVGVYKIGRFSTTFD